MFEGTPVVPLPAAVANLTNLGFITAPADFADLLAGPELEHTMLTETREPPLLIDVRQTLARRVFTHRLTAAEQAGGQLHFLPDLAAIWPTANVPPFDRLDGELLDDYVDEDTGEDVLQLPPGALADHAVGSLVALAVGEDGLHLTAAAEPERDALDPVLQALRGSLFSGPSGDAIEGAVPLDELVLLACAEHPDAFTAPGWPVTDLLALLNLDHRAGLVAPAGFDFEADEEADALDAELGRIADTYELSAEEAAIVHAFAAEADDVHDLLHEIDDAAVSLTAADVADLRHALPGLSEPMVAVAIAEEVLTEDPHLGVALQLILNALEPELPRRSRAGWLWLSAKCSEELDDVGGAEHLLQQALLVDDDYYPAMQDLASIASLRGDAASAVSLLSRAGVPADNPEPALLGRFVGEVRPDVGRNDSCWCGSGRKYKRCHLGRSDFDLGARLGWIQYKVLDWVRTRYGQTLLEWAAASVDLRGAGQQELVQSLIAAVDDPLVVDVALSEGGLLREFLYARGDLLPADEFQLLTGWAATRRQLFAVDEGSAAGWFLTDVPASTGGTGRHLVQLPNGTAAPRHGDLVCARLLEVPGGPTVAGGLVPVAADRRDAVLAALAASPGAGVDPVELIALLSGADPDPAGAGHEAVAGAGDGPGGGGAGDGPGGGGADGGPDTAGPRR